MKNQRNGIPFGASSGIPRYCTTALKHRKRLIFAIPPAPTRRAAIGLLQLFRSSQTRSRRASPPRRNDLQLTGASERTCSGFDFSSFPDHLIGVSVAISQSVRRVLSRTAGFGSGVRIFLRPIRPDHMRSSRRARSAVVDPTDTREVRAFRNGRQSVPSPLRIACLTSAHRDSGSGGSPAADSSTAWHQIPRPRRELRRTGPTCRCDRFVNPDTRTTAGGAADASGWQRRQHRPIFAIGTPGRNCFRSAASLRIIPKSISVVASLVSSNHRFLFRIGDADSAQNGEDQRFLSHGERRNSVTAGCEQESQRWDWASRDEESGNSDRRSLATARLL